MKLFTNIVIILILSLSSLFSQTNYKVRIDEKFDNSDSKDWEQKSSDTQITKIENGVYKLVGLSEKNIGWAFKELDMNINTNYIIEFDIRQTAGPDNSGYGLVSGLTTGSTEFFKFSLSSTQYRKLNGYWNRAYHDLRDWKRKETVIKKMNEWNRIKLVRTRNVLEYYVNDIQVVSYGKFVDNGRNIAFFVEKKGMKVEIDNFKLTTFDYTVKDVAGAEKPLSKEFLSFNTVASEKFCYVSADGNTMYVTQQKDNEKSKVLVSNYDGKNWSELIKLPFPINNNGGNSVISASSDKNTIYLMNTYKPDGSSNSGGISVSNKSKDGWEVPTTIKVDNLVNKNKFASYFFSADNKILILAVQPNEEEYDEQALFVSFIKEDGTYTEPKNLGPTINTQAMDFNPFLAPDSKTLYFSSTGHPGYGSADIWMTRRLDDTWQNWAEPLNLGPFINSSAFELNITLDAKGDFGYLGSYDKSLAGYKGEADIMKIELPVGAKPEPVVLVYGKVLNKKSNEPIAAKINYFDLTTGKEYGTANSDINTGEYSIVLPRGINYGFKSEAAGYVSISENLDLTNLDRYEEIEKNLYLVPIEIGQTIRLNNLFFDTGEYALKESSNSELKNLLKLLQLNPKMKIKIVGYTDNVGTDASNLLLSKNRANSVYDWLISNNVNKANLSSIGMGKKDPIGTNDTEEGRQLNRRVEFTIIEN
jgi:outer membrane protein OmpA-like peptidoglycan-associated protein